MCLFVGGWFHSLFLTVPFFLCHSVPQINKRFEKKKRCKLKKYNWLLSFLKILLKVQVFLKGYHLQTFTLKMKVFVKVLKCLGSIRRSSSWFQLRADAGCGRLPAMAVVTGFLPLTWQSWTEFTAPGFSSSPAAIRGLWGSAPTGGHTLSSFPLKK